jgi:hypothetical protein
MIVPVGIHLTFEDAGMAGNNGVPMQVNEYKYEIERLMRELSDMKRRYFEQKRREQAEAARAAVAPGKLLPALANPSQTRYVGGGFSLASRT